MTYLRANSNLDHKNTIPSLKAYNIFLKKMSRNILHSLYETKEPDWSIFKGGSNGLTILPDQTSQS